MLHTLKKLEKQGFEITLLPVHENGVVDVKELEAAIKDETILVTVMTVNNEIGTIQPIAEIGAVCRAKGVIFHTDAVQAVGHLPIDVKVQQIDMLSASAHKFHGPKGVGFLYAKKGVVLSNLIEGGAQERGKRAGTENVAGIAAMAAALKESVANMEGDKERLTKVRDYLIRGLSEIPHSANLQQRELLLRGYRGRIAAYPARPQGYQCIIGQRMHLGLARSQSRTARDRTHSRRSPRLAEAEP